MKNIIHRNKQIRIFNKIARSFSDKNIFDFKLNFDKTIDFKHFYQTMKNNVDIGMSQEMKSLKLKDIVEKEGAEKARKDIEEFSKYIQEKKLEDVYL